MRVLLIEPAKPPTTIGGEDVFLYEPLALEYVAAGVVRDHDVRILDLRLENDLQSVLTEFCPDVVGATSYTVHVNSVRKLFEQVKEWSPQVLTVVGGHHATVAPEDFSSPFIDLIVMGEGVVAFGEIVARHERGEGFDGIPGVAFTKGGKLARSAPQAAIQLDALPFPARSPTARYRRHYYSEYMKPLASLRTSKGCPYRCKFCALWRLTGGRYLTRRPESVVEELAGLEEEFVFFADDESLVDAERMTRLAKLVKEAGIRKRYFLYARSDTIARNPGLLELWRDIGLERVFVGLESFRDEDLQYVGKRSTVSDNRKAVAILRDLGVDILASFILRPEFSRQDFAALRQHCRQLRLGFCSFAVLTPLPGTALYDEVKDQLLTRNYDYYDFIHTVLPTALPLREFYRQYSQLYANASPLTERLALLRRFPLSEIPALLARHRQFLSRLRTAYLDYGTDAPISPREARS